MLEKILNRRNIERAIKAVERNHGAGGIDDRQSDELRPFVNANCQSLLQRVQEGSYEPSPVRKVEIRKDTGGVRMLGIPKLLSYYSCLQFALGMFIIQRMSVKVRDNSIQEP